MSESGTSHSHFGHQRFCWIRVWHSRCSWLKLIVAAESVAGNTRTGILTSEILRKPFQVGRAAIPGIIVLLALLRQSAAQNFASVQIPNSQFHNSQLHNSQLRRAPRNVSKLLGAADNKP